MSNRESYSDLFDAQVDPQLEQYVANIEAAYRSAAPPTQLNWERFQANLDRQPFQTTQPWPGRIARHLSGGRRGSLPVGLALCALILLLGGSIAYAFTGLPLVLRALFAINPGTDQLLAHQQMTAINQTFEADGYKVMLVNGYADANRVILGLSVALPHPRTSLDKPGSLYISNGYQQFRLVEQQGAALPLLNARGWLDKQGDMEGQLYNFDAANIQGNPAQLLLHLAIPAKCTDGLHSCARTIQFDFTLPFHPGRIMLPHQTVTMNGKTLTLEKVVVAPSETRFYIRGFRMEDSIPPMNSMPKTYTSKHFEIELSNGKKIYTVCTVMYNMCGVYDVIPPEYQQQLFVIKRITSGTSKGEVVAGPGGFDAPLYMGNDESVIGLSLPQSFYKEHGAWTLIVKQTVTQLQLHYENGNPSYYPASPYIPDTLAKPWMFSLNLP